MLSRKKGLLASTVMSGAMAVASPLVFGAFALAPASALAQDYTSGTLIGRVTDSSGAPVSGAAVTVRSASTGVTQNSTTDSSGQFRAPLIPTGSYSVTIRKAGFTDISQDGLSVRIGGESNYGFTLTTPNDLDAVVIVAKKPQPQLDFSQTTKGVAIDVEQLQKQVPIARNVTAVALLAPGVVTSVPGFTNTDGTVVPSIGGGSAGENAFFLNGLNITNFDSYIGGATVPFDFYKTIEVKTGGYSAEFGRATGGVINAVTKSGTNDFFFAVHGNYTPNFTRETAPNTYAQVNAATRSDSSQTSIEAGGPIIRDHLFAYGLYQFNNTVTTTAGGTGQSVTSAAGVTTTSNAGTQTKSRNTSPFYGYKIDGYLTSRQHFEFTDFNTSQTVRNANSNYFLPTPNYASTRLVGTSYLNGGDAQGAAGAALVGNTTKSGGNNYVAKYTGTFTDWFTLSGAYGVNRDESTSIPDGASVAYVTDTRANGTAVRISPVSAAGATTNLDFTRREFYRIDADLYFNFLGRHHVRTGYDNEDTTLSHAQFFSTGGITGGGRFQYYRIRTAGQSTNSGLPIGQEYVRVLTYNLGGNGANVGGTNEAYYIQDSWDITRRLNVQIGVRDDVFKLRNLSGETAVNLKDNFAPRVALSYDPFGNSTDKISASYGRYFIPPASNLSFRGRDLYTLSYYLPPAGLSYQPYINATSQSPTALGPLIQGLPLNAANGYTQACPPGTPAPGGRGCQVNGDGSQEPGATKSAQNLSATYEDEFILSYQKKLNNLWTISASVTYRNLNDVSEDIDNLDTGVFNSCKRTPTKQGCNLSQDDISNTIGARPDYVLINPGKTAIVTVRSDAPAIDPNTGLVTGLSPIAGQTYTLTAADLGFPKPKREYYALELSFDRAFDGKWSLNGSYTLSKSVGNYEGTVKSDAGNSAQTDAGSTQEFDYPGLEDGAYGLLPNHRAHQFKLYGSYQVLSNLSVGANAQITSPRQYGCIGVYPAPGSSTAAGGAGGIDGVAAAYGAASRYCYNPTTGLSSLAPRGDSFSGDWFYQFDVSARYTVPKFSKFMPGDLVLRLDVFNIFNSQQVVQYDEVGDTAAATVSGTYKLPLTYQSPRSVRFGFDLVF